MKDFLAQLVSNPRAAIRSALTTVLAVAAVLAFAGQYVSVPAELVGWVAGAAMILRTLAAALDPGNDSFGITRK